MSIVTYLVCRFSRANVACIGSTTPNVYYRVVLDHTVVISQRVSCTVCNTEQQRYRGKTFLSLS